MTELKTLKDIEKELLETNPKKDLDLKSLDFGYLKAIRRIKQEVIKHIIELGKASYVFGHDNNIVVNQREAFIVQEYLKHLFNITEEDIDAQSNSYMHHQCAHTWVYADRIYTALPPQRDRICSKCGKQECVNIGIKKPFEDTYEGIVEKFKPSETKK